MSSSQKGTLGRAAGLLAGAAALNVLAGIGVAAAQTVLVRSAPAGSTVELVYNTAAVGKATADAGGDATIPLNLQEQAGKPQIDARVFVEVCADMRRVIVAERGQPVPPLGSGCDRREVSGLFVVRRATTLVVNVGGATPTLLLIQGRYDPREPAPRAWSPAATGLVFSAGVGLSNIPDAALQACGDVQDCDGQSWGATYTVGAAFWPMRFFGAEVAYFRPGDVTAEGTGTNFRFNNFLEPHVLTVAGLVGGPAGRARIYGRAGMNYQRSTFGTTQTTDDVTVTVDGVPQTFPGGTQTFELRTSGWSWLFGGGMEVWLKPSLAVYVDGGLGGLKGTNRDGGEGELDDKLRYIVIGAKFRIGG
jgi:hypothetical protein